MTSDRIKVAGVMMSREEAARVRASMRPSRQIGEFIRDVALVVVQTAIVVGGLFAIRYIADMTGPKSSYQYNRFAVVVSGALGCGVIAVLAIRRVKRDFRSRAREAMRNLGWRICTKCNYDLGRDGPAVCPECGAAYEWGDGRSRERE